MMVLADSYTYTLEFEQEIVEILAMRTAPRPRETIPGSTRLQRSATATTSTSIIPISRSGSD